MLAVETKLDTTAGNHPIVPMYRRSTSTGIWLYGIARHTLTSRGLVVLGALTCGSGLLANGMALL